MSIKKKFLLEKSNTIWGPSTKYYLGLVTRESWKGWGLSKQVITKKKEIALMEQKQ